MLKNAGSAESKKLKSELKAAQSHLTKRQQNLEELAANRKSARWF